MPLTGYDVGRGYRGHILAETIKEIEEAATVADVTRLAQAMWDLDIGSKERDQFYRVVQSRIEKLWGRYQTSMYERNRLTVSRRQRMENLGLESS